MSTLSVLYDEFSEEIALMKGGILFIQSSYKGIGLLRDTGAHASVPWPAEVLSVLAGFVVPNRKTENLTYDGAVVLLAATYETYARDTIEAICREIESQIPKFDELNEKIKSANARATGYILSRHSEKKYSKFNYLDLSKSLGTCIPGSPEYHLNSGPLSSHTSNLNGSELGKLFSRIGIDNLWIAIGKTTPIQQYFSITEPGPAQKAAVAKLDEFILLRNQVAHAGRRGSSIGPEALGQWLDFFLAVAESLSIIATAYCINLSSAPPLIPVPIASVPVPTTPAPITPPHSATP